MWMCRLVWLQHHWDPTKNIKWFHSTVLHGRKHPNKKYHDLYEWVEDTVKAEGFVRPAEVREKAAILVDTKFNKYKTFEKLEERIKTCSEL